MWTDRPISQMMTSWQKTKLSTNFKRTAKVEEEIVTQVWSGTKKYWNPHAYNQLFMRQRGGLNYPEIDGPFFTYLDIVWDL